MRIEYLAAVGAALAISLAACGGGASDAAATDVPPSTAGPVTTAAPATTAPPAVTTSIALSSTTTPPPVVTTTVAATTTSVTQDDEGVGAEPSDLEDVVGGTLLDAGWLAEPGIYISNALSMPILFDLKDPVSYVEWFDDSITFGRQDVSLTQMDAVVLSSFVGIVPSTEIGIHPGDSSIIPDNTEDLPDDLGDWLAAAPQLIIAGSGETTVAGEPAFFWDIEVDPAAGDTFPCDYGDCVAAMVHPVVGYYVMGDNFMFRIWQLTGSGQGVYAFVQSAPGNYDDTVALATMILEGMSFDVPR